MPDDLKGPSWEPEMPFGMHLSFHFRRSVSYSHYNLEPRFPELKGRLKDAAKRAFRALDTSLDWVTQETTWVLADEANFGRAMINAIRQQKQSLVRAGKKSGSLASLVRNVSGRGNAPY